MRLRRILAAAIVTSLAAPAALLTTAAPASAATATKIVGGTEGQSWIYRSYSSAGQPGGPVFGDTLRLDIEVQDANGAQVYDGTLTVQRQLPGKSWKTLKTSTSAYLYDSIKAAGNANYRVLYSGAGDFSPSDAGVKSKVQRKIEIKNVGDRKVVLQGKVSPKYKGKVVIFKKNGKKWKKVKTVRTNKKSTFRTPLPAPRSGRYYWNVKIKGSKTFAPSQTGKFYTYSY
ncbi:MAG: hypothetical protein EON52_13315 [Actinomycetales bacterium]|nr:MAG: hypothetical protein EON52_13315 [Actinomycetales bacterium]